MPKKKTSKKSKRINIVGKGKNVRAISDDEADFLRYRKKMGSGSGLTPGQDKMNRKRSRFVKGSKGTAYIGSKARKKKK
jgi:hypothetical protein